MLFNVVLVTLAGCALVQSLPTQLDSNFFPNHASEIAIRRGEDPTTLERPTSQLRNPTTSEETTSDSGDSRTSHEMDSSETDISTSDDAALRPEILKTREPRDIYKPPLFPLVLTMANIPLLPNPQDECAPKLPDAPTFLEIVSQSDSKLELGKKGFLALKFAGLFGFEWPKVTTTKSNIDDYVAY